MYRDTPNNWCFLYRTFLDNMCKEDHNALVKERKKRRRNKVEYTITFEGGIIDMEKSEKPIKLTKEQSRQLGELIYLSFRRWHEKNHQNSSSDRTDRRDREET